MNPDLTFGHSPSFVKLIETIDRYAQATAWPVLILGETGVGKELVAHRIHLHSKREPSRFVPVNCGALPPLLFESELFGYERGAFSGAVQSSPGILRQAREGTVFLDEIGELDLSLQVKLLRFLDSGEVESVGGARVERVDTRIVAATNVDLYAAVRAGSFRSDLLERLSVLAVDVPPLRERTEDIPEIARTILRRMNAPFEEGIPEALVAYEWPGNVRQLRNVLVRAVVRAGRRIRVAEVERLLEEERQRKGDRFAVNGKEIWQGSLEEIEKQVIVDRLRRVGGNRKRAAKELGIAKSTLHEKIKRWKTQGAEAVAWPVDRGGHLPSLEL